MEDEMGHVLKYKVGDKVRIVKDQFEFPHGMEIGSIFNVERVSPESRTGEKARNYQEYKLDSGMWVAETEIESA